MSKAWKNFHLAMYALTSDAPQRDRLLRALKLHLSRLDAQDVPSEIRTEFARLMAGVDCADGKGGTDGIQSNIDAADSREIASMINAIIKMYDAVTRYQPLLKDADRPERTVA
jgi:hypothetical protein